MADEKIYETYKDYPKLSPLVTELSWSHNLLILFQTQTIEEKNFILKPVFMKNGVDGN